MISLEQVKKIFPYAPLNIAEFIDPLNETFDLFEINTPLRQAAFFGQIAVESRQLNKLRENTNYTTVARLLEIFPMIFTLESAKECVGNPMMIANKIYANKYGNGDEDSGDGWKYRGGGAMMITFKANYEVCGCKLGIDLISTPELLIKPEWAIKSAGWFFSYRSLNALADVGEFNRLTKKVNVAMLDLDTRIEFYEKAKEVLA